MPIFCCISRIASLLVQPYYCSLCCRGDDPGYKLVVDGSTLGEGNADDFGEDISFSFGNCNTGGSGSGGEGGGSSCIPFTLDLLTDAYGYEVSIFLQLENGDYLWSWDENSFEDDTPYLLEACLDPEGCAELSILDSFGDGYVYRKGGSCTHCAAFLLVTHFVRFVC